MNKNESKYFNTARKMDEALIALLEKKDFEYITVKEICSTAGVNRSTFYLHYENTSDLLKETTEYIVNKHLEYYSVDTTHITDGYKKCDKKDLLFITSEYLTPYLTFVKENQKIFKVALKQFYSMNFDKVYGRMYDYIFNPILELFGIPKYERRYVMKFYLSGITAVVMEWLNNDCQDDIDSIIKIICDCVMGDRSIEGENH